MMSLTHEYHNGNRICCNICKADIELVKLWRKLSACKTFNEERYKIWTLDCGLDHRLNNGIQQWAKF